MSVGTLTAERVRRLRLAHQHLVAPSLDDPAAVVSRMLAVQAQEYPMARWAVALRTKSSATDNAVEQACDDGRILRLHVLRPTWHFVAAEDIRLVLQVTAPRVHQANAFLYRKLGLDRSALDRFSDWVGALLADGNHLTRQEIRDRLPAGWVEVEGIRMAYLLMYAELEGVVVSGPRRGRQPTYALLDERAAPTPRLDDDEALVVFLRRYLQSRAPATIPDITTWSGLTVAQVRRGLAALGDEVTTVEEDGHAYLLMADTPEPPAELRSFLMPDYDEYGMAYKDRSAIASPGRGYWTLPWNRAVVVDGVIAGSWQRSLQRGVVTVEVEMFDISDRDPRVVTAAEEYATFLGCELDLEFVEPAASAGRRQ